jgi:hypothetical protein
MRLKLGRPRTTYFGLYRLRREEKCHRIRPCTNNASKDDADSRADRAQEYRCIGASALQNLGPGEAAAAIWDQPPNVASRARSLGNETFR